MTAYKQGDVVLVSFIFSAIKETMIARRLGAVSPEDRRAIRDQLKHILGL
jgi:hypothetical protein